MHIGETLFHYLELLHQHASYSDLVFPVLWGSPEEAGRYLETYKSYENKPADLLKEHVEKDYLSKVDYCTLHYITFIIQNDLERVHLLK